ncbi:MAG: hypothetical protein ACYTGC_10440, partial [Planctomycetota bacterium]
VLLMAVGGLRGGPWPSDRNPLGLLVPLCAVIGFVAVAWWKMSNVSGRVAAEKFKRYGAMWQSLYGASWLAALGLITEALWISAFAIAGFAAMTLIKEVTGLSGKPIAYR